MSKLERKRAIDMLRIVCKSIIGIRRISDKSEQNIIITKSIRSNRAKRKVNKCANTDETGRRYLGKFVFLIKSLFAIREDVPD